MKKAILIFLCICLTFSCITTKTFYFTNGNKETQYVYRNNKRIKSCSWHESGKKRIQFVYRNNKLIKSYSWYESGKRESKSKIISVDTVIVFEPAINDSMSFPEIKQKRIDWFEDGEIKEIETPCNDGTREIISYDWNETKNRKTTFLLNKMIKEEVIAQNYNSHSRNTFSKKWKVDSLGKKGYRVNFYNSLIKDTTPFNLAHLKKEQVLELLGQPNRITHENLTLVFDYFLTGGCGFSEEGCYRFVLEIKFANEIETQHYTSFIKNTITGTNK